MKRHLYLLWNKFASLFRDSSCLPASASSSSMPTSELAAGKLGGSKIRGTARPGSLKHRKSVILAVWEAPGKHFGCLGGSWETFCWSVRLLGDILAAWEAPLRHFACLGGFLDTFWSSEWILGEISAVLGDILPVWEAAGKHFG